MWELLTKRKSMLSNTLRYQVQSLCLYHLGANFSYFLKDTTDLIYPEDPKRWDTFAEWAEGNVEFWILAEFSDRRNWKQIKEYAREFTKSIAELWVENAGLINKTVDRQEVSI